MPSSPSAEAPVAKFICDRGFLARFSCIGLPFYRKHEGKRYCVLHYPDKDKAADFDVALKRKLDAEDFYFGGLWFPIRVDFFGHAFTKPVNFTDATFADVADFCSATFNAEASFVNASFRSAAVFGDAVFGMEANFTGATFQARADFTNSSFKKRPTTLIVSSTGQLTSATLSLVNGRIFTGRPLRKRRISVKPPSRII